MERIKLIWDFRGPTAIPTAKHHVIHLKEFVKAEGLQHTICDIQKVSEMNCSAYLVVEKEHMDRLREQLKPHRGQVFSD
ncbi:hypothetical protein ACFQO1_04700 [Jejudonia soesokkakensis]|uniref:Uncharacterized protein n=1 Tax=Jejudonia soesokkakensis TaxID=1323432 RepID=A0ABW2MUH6_9FLAO